MPDIPAIDGLADASDARVMLYQSGRLVHAPARAIGLQPQDPTLTALAGLATAADKGVYFDGADSAQLFDLTTAGRALLDDADAAAQRTTLGVPWERIRADAPSGVASVTWTGLGAYRLLRAYGFIRPATDGVNVFFRTSTNNGSSFDSGAANYLSAFTFMNSAAAVGGSLTTPTALSFGVTAIGNTAPEGVYFDFLFQQFNQAAQMEMQGLSHMLDTSGSTHTAFFSGRRLDTTARNALQLAFASGNIATGAVWLDGVRG